MILKNSFNIMKNNLTLKSLTKLTLAFFMVAMMLPAMAQDEKYGEDKNACLENLSLYQEFYKQWKNSGYKKEVAADIAGPWRWCIANCPKASQKMYQDGVKLYSRYFIPNAANDEEKLLYLDTLLTIIDKRIEYFPTKKGASQVGYLLGRKGTSLYSHNPAAYEATYKILKESVKLDGNNTKSGVAALYFKLGCVMANNEKIDIAEVVANFEEVSAIVEFNLEKYATSTKYLPKWQKTLESIETEFEPFASCEALVGIFQVKFEAAPTDVENLKKIAETLDKNKCFDSELFFTVTQKLYEIEPSAEAAYLMSSILLKEENYAEAITYLTDAVSLLEDPEMKANAELKLANAYYNMQNYSQTRAHALACLAIRPTEGNAYILIGNCYVATAKNCGKNDFEQSAVYWIAVDQYQKAKKVDSTIADMANRMINSYSKYFPNTETIFFNDYKDGDSFKIGCWINGTTTVRAAK